MFKLLTKGPHTLKNLRQTKRAKSQKKKPQSHGNAKFLHILERIVFLRVDFPNNLTKVLQLSISIKKSLILML